MNYVQIRWQYFFAMFTFSFNFEVNMNRMHTMPLPHSIDAQTFFSPAADKAVILMCNTKANIFFGKNFSIFLSILKCIHFSLIFCFYFCYFHFQLNPFDCCSCLLMLFAQPHTLLVKCGNIFILDYLFSRFRVER